MEKNDSLCYNMIKWRKCFKMDKKIVHDLKKYAWVGQIAIATVVTLAMGIILGLFLDYCFETTYWIIITSIVFLIIAVCNFIYHILKLGKMK